MTNRDEGFYWVVDGRGSPEVAAWVGGRWWLTGSEEPAIDTMVVVLSPCLVPPSCADETAEASRPDASLAGAADLPARVRRPGG